MLVYIIYNSHCEEIEHVFKHEKDAKDMLDSLPSGDRDIQVHEVIE